MTENCPSKNIVLIGMPGAGKSTVGVLLAKETSRNFLDTDLLIQTRHHQTLQQIVNEQGHEKLRLIEEKVVLSVEVTKTVIATGGSVVYGDTGMKHLKESGIVIFLDVPLPELEIRLGDFRERGIAKKAEQSINGLYQERVPLYQKYADETISCGQLSAEQVSQKIIQALS